LYFATGQWDGGTDVLGATTPATTWLFAEGTTRPGYQEYLTLQNPGPADTTATVTFQPAVAPPLTVTLPAHSRTTLDLNHTLNGAVADIALAVTAGTPVVA